MALQLATDPDGFMERKVGQANIRVEILIVLLVGAMASLGALYVVLQVLEVENAAEMRIASAGQVIRPLLVMLVLWGVYTVLLHFLSAHYGGRNPPSQVLKGLAWALVPVGIGNLVQAGALYYVFRDADVEARIDGVDPAERLQAVFDSSMTEPVMIGATVVFMGMLLLSGYLMTFVIQHAKGLDRDEALRVVAVPVVLHLLVVIWALVQGTTNFGLVLVVGTP
jgi:hypothetical protein